MDLPWFVFYSININPNVINVTISIINVIDVVVYGIIDVVDITRYLVDVTLNCLIEVRHFIGQESNNVSVVVKRITYGTFQLLE